MGDFPMMTERGTFIINGTERVVVTQLVRSPGRLPDGAEGPREAGLHREPDAGPRLVARARDRQEGPRLRPHRPQAQAAGHDAAARAPARTVDRAGSTTDEEILELFDDSLYIRNTLEADTEARAEEGALIEVFKKQRPGEPPTLDNAREPPAPALLRPQALRPHAGRPLQAQPAPRRSTSTSTRASLTPRRHRRARPASSSRCPTHPRHVRGARRDIKDYAAEALQLSARADRASDLDEYEHFGNRRLRTVGELIQEAFRDRPLPDGARRPRADDDRGRRHDHAADDHQHPPGRGGAEGVLRLLAALAVHGPDELARRPHAPPPPVGARRRRPHARARADRGARRAPDPLRPHVPDRDAGGPEHRPDRLALELRATVSEFGFVTTPYRVVKDGKVTDEIVYLDATEEAGAASIAQANEPVDEKTASSDEHGPRAARRPASYVHGRAEGRRPAWTSRRSRSCRSRRR